MNTTRPFLYIIGWTALNRSYIGVRYARGCQPSDLWSTYFTSSKIVKDFVKEHGDPDTFSIHEGSEESVKLVEFWCIHFFNLAADDEWLNLKGNGRFFHRTVEGARKAGESLKRKMNDPTARELRKQQATERWADPDYRDKQTTAIRKSRTGTKHTADSIEKMSVARRAYKWSAERKTEVSERLRNNPIQIPAEARQRAAEKLRGVSRSDETKEKIRKAATGKRKSDDQKIEFRLRGRFMSFEEFNQWLRFHNIKTHSDWVSFRAHEQLPFNIPKIPLKYYGVDRGRDYTWKEIKNLIESQ